MKSAEQEKVSYGSFIALIFLLKLDYLHGEILHVSVNGGKQWGKNWPTVGTPFLQRSEKL